MFMSANIIDLQVHAYYACLEILSNLVSETRASINAQIDIFYTYPPQFAANYAHLWSINPM